MGKIVSKTLDEVMQNLPEKPFREFPDDFEPDTSDIAEISTEEFDRMHRYTNENRTLCRIIRALIEHNLLSIENAQSKMGAMSSETLHLIMKTGQAPVRNAFLLIAISLLLMDRKIKIPGVVEKLLKGLSKSAA